jgi:hypothetical protein
VSDNENIGDGLLNVTARGPLDTLKSRELIVAQRVQTRSKRHTTASGGAIWVLVVGIESRMEVLDMISKYTSIRIRVTYKVLLHVDERDVVLRKKLANACSVGILVTRDFIAVQDRWQAGNVECNCIELARGLSKCRTQERDLEQEGAHGGGWKLSSWRLSCYFEILEAPDYSYT